MLLCSSRRGVRPCASQNSRRYSATRPTLRPGAASVIGQWLLGRKYLENWIAWIVVNVVSVGLFAYKGLWLTVILYAIFIAMSIVGWRAWRRLVAASMPAAAAA